MLLLCIENKKMGSGKLDYMLHHFIIDFFYALGFWGEFISILIVGGYFRHDTFYFVVFILGHILNTYLNNGLLKPWFKEGRPRDPIKFLASENFNNKVMHYGMPSGHSQTTFFSIMYLYLTIHQIYPWVLILLFIAFAVMFQRVYFHNHTITQVVVGAIFGSLVAGIVVYARDNIENIMSKKDL